MMKGFYSVLHEDGHPRVVHGFHALVPEGATAITETQAREISAATRARGPKPIPLQTPQPASPVDLQPILDQIAALTRTAISHAELHDQHTEAIAKASAKMDDQSGDITKFKENTAKAIAQMTEGIGEKSA